jgi:hypothetical protein
MLVDGVGEGNSGDSGIRCGRRQSSDAQRRTVDPDHGSRAKKVDEGLHKKTPSGLLHPQESSAQRAATTNSIVGSIRSDLASCVLWSPVFKSDLLRLCNTR